MELFEQIRREYEHGVGTINGVAKKLGMHRRLVREALSDAMPRERKVAQRERPKLAGAVAFIDAILEADRKAPRKQRHTAHRIWCRLRAEMRGSDGGGVDGARVRTGEEDGAGTAARRSLRSAVLSLRARGSGRLVRSLGGDRRRTAEGFYLLHAQHGQWRGVSLRLSACQPTGLSGSARVGVCVLWRHLRACCVTTIWAVR